MAPAADTKTLLDALLAVQKEAPALRKTAANKHFGNTYAPLDTIVETINPILHKHKLVWTTLPVAEDYGPALTYRLSHVPSGESLEGTMPLLLSKQDAQGQGSAITYARRYSLCAVLNLVAEDDDDGARASSKAATAEGPNGRAGRPSEAQLEFLQNLIKRKKPSVAQLKIMLADPDLVIEEGWTSRLSGGRDGQVSALIAWLKDRPLPEVPEFEVPASDVPSDDKDFIHPPAGDLKDLPIA